MELAVDVVVLASRHVLLVKRANEPFAGRWALPGGFVEPGELLVDAASRELAEETGVLCRALHFCGLYDDPARDPRGRVVSVGFVGLLNEQVDVVGASDATKAQWVNIKDVGVLAFDHNQILADALGRVS